MRVHKLLDVRDRPGRRRLSSPAPAAVRPQRLPERAKLPDEPRAGRLVLGGRDGVADVGALELLGGLDDGVEVCCVFFVFFFFFIRGRWMVRDVFRRLMLFCSQSLSLSFFSSASLSLARARTCERIVKLLLLLVRGEPDWALVGARHGRGETRFCVSSGIGKKTMAKKKWCFFVFLLFFYTTLLQNFHHFFFFPATSTPIKPNAIS